MFQAQIAITDQDVRTISSTQGGVALGQMGMTANGRCYRYAQAGAVELAPGKVVTNPAVDSNVVDVTVAAAAAIGDTQVTIDAGGSITANAYAEGSLGISDATGEGIEYLVTGNSAVSGAGEITVDIQEPVEVALVADTSKATLIKNPWDGVIIVPATDQADFPAGVPNVTVTAAYYCWIQTKGICAVWADETFARGAPLTFGTGSAGQVEAVDAAGEVQFGVAIEAASNADDYPQVFLQID